MAEPTTKPADILDAAAELTQADTERSIEAAKRRAAPEVHPAFDGVHCVECGEAVPRERLALGRVLCVDCQTFKERDEALRRRR